MNKQWIRSRLQSIGVVAALLAVNFFTTLWLQGMSISSAWANVLGQDAPPAVTAAGVTAVTIPATFNYQGYVRGPDGTLVTGSYTIVARLYADAVGGASLHQEPFTNIPVRDGLFNIVLGDAVPFTTNLFLNNAPLYLGVTLLTPPATDGGQELIPRQRIHAVPWALTASTLTPNAIVNGLANMSYTVSYGPIEAIGDVRMFGDVTATAIRDVWVSQGKTNRVSYLMSLRRYVLEVKNNQTGKIAPVDGSVLTEYCADEDGCAVSISLRDWNSDDGLMTTKGPYHFSVGKVTNSNKRRWRIDGRVPERPDLYNALPVAIEGVDGDSIAQIVLAGWNCVFIEDGIDEPSDGALGFHLGANVSGYVSPTTTCLLTIED